MTSILIGDNILGRPSLNSKTHSEEPPSKSKFSDVFHIIEETISYKTGKINLFFQKECHLHNSSFSLKQCIDSMKREGDQVFVTGEWVDHLFFGKKEPSKLELIFKVSDPESTLSRITSALKARDISFASEKTEKTISFKLFFELEGSTYIVCFLIQNKDDDLSNPSFKTVALQVTTPFLNQIEEKMPVCAYGQGGCSVDKGVVYAAIEKRKRNIVENFFLFDIGMGEIEELPSKILETKNYPPDMLEMFLQTLGGDLHLKALSHPKIINVFIHYIHTQFSATSLFEKLQCIFEIVFFLELGKAPSLIGPFLEQAGGAIRKSLRLENKDVLSKGLSVLNSLSAKEISSTVLLQKWQKILQFLVLYTLQTTSSIKGLNIELKLIEKKQFAFLSLEGGEGFHINLPESTALGDVSEEEVFACFPFEDFSFESLPLEHRKGGRVFFGKVQVEKKLVKEPSVSSIPLFITTTTFNETSPLHQRILYSSLHDYHQKKEDQPYKGLLEQLAEWSKCSFKAYLENPLVLFRFISTDEILLKHLIETKGKQFFRAYFPSDLQLMESEIVKEEIKAFFNNEEISLSVKRLFATTLFPLWVEQPRVDESIAFLTPFLDKLITVDSLPLQGYQLHALRAFHDQINRRQTALFPKVKTKEEIFKGKKQTEGYKTLEKNLKGKKETEQLNEIFKSFKNLNKEEKGIIFELMISLLLRMQTPPESRLRDLLDKSKEYWDKNLVKKGILLCFCYNSKMREAYLEHLKEGQISLFKIYFDADTEIETALSSDINPEEKMRLKEKATSFASAFSAYLLIEPHLHPDTEIVKKAIQLSLKEEKFEQAARLITKYEKTSVCIDIIYLLALLKGKWKEIAISSENAPFLFSIFSLINDKEERDLILAGILESNVRRRNSEATLEVMRPFCRKGEEENRLFRLILSPFSSSCKNELPVGYQHFLLKLFKTVLNKKDKEFFSESFKKLSLEFRVLIFKEIIEDLSKEVIVFHLESISKEEKFNPLLIEAVTILPRDSYFHDTLEVIFRNPEKSIALKSSLFKEWCEKEEGEEPDSVFFEALEELFFQLPLEIQGEFMDFLPFEKETDKFISYLNALNTQKKEEQIIKFFDAYTYTHDCLNILDDILKNREINIGTRRTLFKIISKEIIKLEEETEIVALSHVLEAFYNSSENKGKRGDLLESAPLTFSNTTYLPSLESLKDQGKMEELIDFLLRIALKNPQDLQFYGNLIKDLLLKEDKITYLQKQCLFQNCYGCLEVNIQLQVFLNLVYCDVENIDLYEDVFNEMCRSNRSEKEWELFFSILNASRLIMNKGKEEEKEVVISDKALKLLQFMLIRLADSTYRDTQGVETKKSEFINNLHQIELNKRIPDVVKILKYCKQSNITESLTRILYLNGSFFGPLSEFPEGLAVARFALHYLRHLKKERPGLYEITCMFVNLFNHFYFLYIKGENLTVNDLYELMRILPSCALFDSKPISCLNIMKKASFIFKQLLISLDSAKQDVPIEPQILLGLSTLVCSEEEVIGLKEKWGVREGRSTEIQFVSQFDAGLLDAGLLDNEVYELFVSISQNRGPSFFQFFWFIEKMKDREDPFRAKIINYCKKSIRLRNFILSNFYKGIKDHFMNLIVRSEQTFESFITGEILKNFLEEIGGEYLPTEIIPAKLAKIVLSESLSEEEISSFSLTDLVLFASTSTASSHSSLIKKSLIQALIKDIEKKCLTLEKLNFFIYLVTKQGPFSLEKYREIAFPLIGILLKNAILEMSLQKTVLFYEKGVLFQLLLLDFFEFIVVPFVKTEEFKGEREKIEEILDLFGSLYEQIFKLYVVGIPISWMPSKNIEGFFIEDFREQYIQGDVLKLEIGKVIDFEDCLSAAIEGAIDFPSDLFFNLIRP